METIIMYLPFIVAGILALVGTYILESMLKTDGKATILAFLVMGVIAYFSLQFIGIF